MTPQRYIPARRYDTDGATQTDNDRRLTELEDRIPKLSTGKSATWNITRVDSGGGGNSQNDQRYLKLVADNDPLTGDLDIKVNAEHALRVLDNTVAVTDAGELWLFGADGIYYTTNYADPSPIWNIVSGGYPSHAGRLEYAGITRDGSAVYAAYVTSYVNSGIFVCKNPKSATPIWTDILAGAGPSAGVARYSGNQRGCGIQENTFWAFCNSAGIWYHRGTYNGTAWSWSNELTGLCATTDGWYGPRNYYRFNKLGGEIYDISSGIGYSLVKSSSQSVGGSVWSHSSTSHVTISGSSFTSGDLQIADTSSSIATLSGITSALYYYDVAVNGSQDGNRVFAVQTSGANRGRIWVGDTSSVSLKDTWTYAHRIHDSKLVGGGLLAVTVSQCADDGEVARVSTDGGDTWTDATGNFWTLTSGAKTFYNSGMAYTSGSATTMFNVDTLTGDTDVVRLIALQTVQGTRFLSTVATGTSPLSIVSTTLNTNLNADLLDGSHASAFVPITRTISTTAPLTGGGDLSANRTLSISRAATASDGYLSSTDWNTFNNKQPAGNYITALTGDVTATGPGSAAATLATVNSNVGSFTYASITVNAKGLITAASSGTAPTTGSGTAGRVTQWATTSTLGNSNIIGSGAGVLTLSAAGAYTLTVPATGIAAIGAGTLTVLSTNDATGSAHTHAITASSDVSAGTSALLKSDAGALTLATLTLPNTTSTVGVIKFGADRFLHIYGDPATLGQNVFVGVSAGNFTMGGSGTEGSRNVALGYSALSSNTTGERNTAVGWSAEEHNTTGFHNTGIGDQALRANTIGNQNAAFGVSALLNNISGNKNMAVGFSALHDNTTGYENLAIGANAMLNCIDGISNVAVGSDALSSALSPSGNVAVGAQVLQVSDSGVWNTGLGFQALTSQTGANFNTAVGSFAQKSNVSGGFNTSVGLQSLYSATAASGNVALGFQAGYYETGSNKLFIDNAARSSESDARVQALIYGVFDSDPANQTVTANALLTARMTSATYNAAVEALRIEARTTGTAGAGFGPLTAFYAEDGSADTYALMSSLSSVWTKETHASRTALFRGSTVGNAVETGFFGAWSHDAVSTTALTVIPDGTGDVTKVATLMFSVYDNTSQTSNGGVVVLNPNGGAITLLSDGTNYLSIECATAGNVTVVAAGHTFKISLWGTWL